MAARAQTHANEAANAAKAAATAAAEADAAAEDAAAEAKEAAMEAERAAEEAAAAHTANQTDAENSTTAVENTPSLVAKQVLKRSWSVASVSAVDRFTGCECEQSLFSTRPVACCKKKTRYP